MLISRDKQCTTAVKDTVHRNLQRVRHAGPDNLVALCPFHDDSSPSFAISIHTGLWLCYACGEKGNFRSFLSKLGMSKRDIDDNYGDTLAELKRNAPPEPDIARPEIVMEVNRHVPEELLGVFRSVPEKLLQEGFSEEVLRHFEVGMDNVHHRITYPLRDLEGNLVGISGRATLDSQEERYKVYKNEYRAWDLPPYETDKSNLLWNSNVIYPLARVTEMPIVIVEGFKACMWLHQAGVTNVLALMTKRMSWAQEYILQSMGGPYIMMLDNDDAGIDGTIKISKVLQKYSRDVRIVEYEQEQPTDIPQEDVPGLIEDATDYQQIMVQ